MHVDTLSGDVVFCESCIYAKVTQKPVAKVQEAEWANKLGGEVHTDLWGPAPVATIKWCRYYISFMDNETCLTHLYLVKHKSDTLCPYKEYEVSLNTQHNATVHTLHSDCGGEYTGKEFILHLKWMGTRQKPTVHDTPQHNGVAK